MSWCYEKEANALLLYLHVRLVGLRSFVQLRGNKSETSEKARKSEGKKIEEGEGEYGLSGLKLQYTLVKIP